MSQVPLSPELLLGLVRRVRRKGGPWRPIGIHTRTAYTGPTKLAFAEGGPRVELDVVNCPSLLAVRSALAEERVHPLVFVTQQDEDDLGADVRARIAKGRLQHPGSWEVALDLFEAQTLDPALGKQTWLADELIRARPPSGYAPVPTGVLDAEVAWGAFLREVVGLGDARPDLRSLLRWSSKAGAASRLAAQTSAVRRAVADRLVDSAGSVARAVLHVACSDRSADVVPVGIVAELLFASSFEEDASIQTGVVRLEPLLGGHALSRREGRAWAEAARAVAAGAEESDDVALAGAWYRRAEALLDELKVRAYAHRSDVLPLGFEQRVERLAHALQDWLEAGTKAVPDEAEQAYKMLSQHRVARRERARLQRAEMALRLARWLRLDDADEAASLAERARSYERDGAFVDRARTQLGAGDAHPALAAVYGRLVDTATKRRERENQDFGTALSGWLASGGSANGILPIEDVLERVLAPVAKSAPALLLVMDGMSHAVYRELLESLGELAWGPQVPAEGNGFDPVVAVLPSVTNVSRTSLLCGRLASGAQSIEKDGFASHPALLAVSRTAKPP
ncbi:MAG: BREX-2 system phosphatase PglZ, partial [Planctomycetes bacterium]|nr:BREX-2 system phosphatase PglZ [Planctomycetota bacterium]